MKKNLLIITLGLLSLTLIGCSKKKFNVDLDGNDFCYLDPKTSYAEGETVELFYNLIATDTDYSFEVEGADDAKITWENECYVIRFTMPAHDVKVIESSYNSMVNDSDVYEDSVE